MDENFEEPFHYRILMEEELYHNTEKINDNENNEQKDVNTDLNNVNNTQAIVNSNKNKNDNSHFYYNSNINIPYNNNDKQINDGSCNLYGNEIMQKESNKYSNKNQNEAYYNIGEVFYNTQYYIEQNDNKKTYNTSNTIQLNGKQIITTNELVTGAFFDIFNNNEMNLENKSDMQYLRKKKRRRTKLEVEHEKKLKKKEIKPKKKLGRKRKLELNKGINISEHSKKSDDNIVKKINSYFLDSMLKWINKSFLDKNRTFQTLADRKKMKYGIIRKISPQIITTNLKKKNVISTMNSKFKDIFSNKISTKYSKVDVNSNKKLIDKIYLEQDQPFVIYLLELTFIEAFKYFNGQNQGDDCREFFFLRNFDEDIINQFLSNFDTIRNFLSEIKSKENNETKDMIQDYCERITLLCLNYSDFFINKFDRSENKKKKEIKEKKEEGNN